MITQLPLFPKSSARAKTSVTCIRYNHRTYPLKLTALHGRWSRNFLLYRFTTQSKQPCTILLSLSGTFKIIGRWLGEQGKPSVPLDGGMQSKISIYTGCIHLEDPCHYPESSALGKGSSSVSLTHAWVRWVFWVISQ